MGLVLRAPTRLGRAALVVVLVTFTTVSMFPAAFARPMAPLGSAGRGAAASTSASAKLPGPTPSAFHRLPPPPVPGRDGATSGRVASREVFPPAPAVRAGSGGPEGSGYTQVPAPMGLADLGVGSSGPYVYNTSSFVASITFQEPFSAYSPGYAGFVEAPNWASLQLNTVAVNVSYPREPTGHYGTFWVQNVVHFNGTTLEFEDNVWNFTTTSEGLNAGTLLHPLGTLVAGEYYYRNGPTISSLRYPFTLELFNNLSLVNQRATVYLNYSVSGQRSGSYDTVTFAQAQSVTPQFQVNGLATDGSGRWNDAELDIGGDGSGSNAMVQELNATVSLRHWNSVLSQYTSIPSAYDHGVDSAETSAGIAATWNGAAETLEQGPSMLYGLWGTSSSYGPSAAEGAIRVGLTVSPAWGFVFATDSHSLAGHPLAQANLAYFPTGPGGAGSTELPPPSAADPYELVAWAAGYANTSSNPTAVTGNLTGLKLSLTGTPIATLQAPLYLSGDAEAAALGAAGIAGITYNVAHRTLAVGAQADTLAPPFLELNDFLFPMFVLFAADEVNVSVDVNDFQQASGASTYGIDIGGTETYPGYSQGYYFFYGTGSFDVTNTTLPGNSTAYWDWQAYPPAAVEFYDTVGSAASNIVSSQESFGVAFVNSTGGSANGLTSEAGANAVDVVYSQQVLATNVSALGLDYRGTPSWGAYVVNASTVHLRTLYAAKGALAFAASNTSSVVVNQLATDNASAVEAENVSDSAASALSVSDSNPSSFAGFWNDSAEVSVTHVSVVGLGFEFMNDPHFSGVGVSSTGPGSEAVYDFVGSTNGSFSYVNATDQALGLNLSYASNLSLASVDAADGSVGVYALSANGTVVTGVDATNESAGFVWQFGANGTISHAQGSDESVPVVVTNVTNLTVSQVAVSNTSLGAPGFVNPAMGFLLPEAAVYLANDTNVTVNGVTAMDYGFAVLAYYDPSATTIQNVLAWSDGTAVGLNFTNDTEIQNVLAWNGGTAVALNVTNGTEVDRLFAFSDQLGIDANTSSNLTVHESTLEDSGSFGFFAVNGANVTVEGDNFIANDGSAIDGRFVAAHVQASIANATNVTLAANYWADHTGSSPYVLSRAYADRQPLSAFNGTSLLVNELGLPAGTPWSVSVSDGAVAGAYATRTSLFYVPSWSLPSGTVTYFVPPLTGYTATPSQGTVTYSGQNATVTIQYNVSSSGGGGGGTSSLGLYVGVGATVGVVAVVAALLLRRPRGEGGSRVRPPRERRTRRQRPPRANF